MFVVAVVEPLPCFPCVEGGERLPCNPAALPRCAGDPGALLVNSFVVVVAPKLCCVQWFAVLPLGAWWVHCSCTFAVLSSFCGGGVALTAGGRLPHFLLSREHLCR